MTHLLSRSARLPRSTALLLAASGVLASACGGDSASGTPTGSTGSGSTMPGALAQTLFVAHPGALSSYDVARGDERPGEVQDLPGPVDMQVLADGTVMVNLTDKNEILIVDGETMLEKARLPSSSKGGTRPVHSFITPTIDGKTYWVSTNDGASGMVQTDSALFVDVTPGSKGYLKAAGEVGLGIGHHKATFSDKLARVVVSNIADCDNLLSVYDYTDITSIKTLATLSAKDAGWDGSSQAKTCDPSYKMGVPPAPHGCSTSKMSGKAYCNLTSSGGIVVTDIDASPPTFKVVPTTGSGAGYTRALPGGHYVYSLQSSPREGDKNNPGAKCQIGQLVVIDATTDSIAATVPLLYKGPGCTDALAGTDEETDGPSHILVSEAQKKLFIEVAGGFQVAEARSRRELVIDISNPAAPVQLASVQVGTSNGDHGDTLSGDGKFVFVTNTVDGTVSQIDTATNQVVTTIKVKDHPSTVATYGTAEGPSEQTGPLP